MTKTAEETARILRFLERTMGEIKKQMTVLKAEIPNASKMESIRREIIKGRTNEERIRKELARIRGGEGGAEMYRQQLARGIWVLEQLADGEIHWNQVDDEQRRWVRLVRRHRMFVLRGTDELGYEFHKEDMDKETLQEYEEEMKREE